MKARQTNLQHPEPQPAVRDTLLLLLVSAIWGSTFLLTRKALNHTQPFTFLSVRFGIAFVVLSAVSWRKLTTLRWQDLRMCSSAGVLFFLSVALQTLGAPLIRSSEAGFLVSMSIPLVPFAALIALRQKPTLQGCVGLALALVGTMLMSGVQRTGLHPGLGQVLMLLSAVCVAFHVVIVGKTARLVDAGSLAVVQVGMVALCSPIMILVRHEPHTIGSPVVWVAAIGMALFATSFALVAMAKAQRRLSSTRASLIYATEPVWAGGFGVLAGEALRPSIWSGCGLILAGLIVGSVSLHGMRRQPTGAPVTE